MKSKLVSEKVVPRKNIIIPDNASCPRCGEKKLVGGGRRYTKYKQKYTQRYKCKACGTNFTNWGYLKGKHPIELMQYTVSLYLKGYSSRRVSSILKKAGYKISHNSVLNWVKKLGFNVRKKDCLRKRKIKEVQLKELIELTLSLKIRLLSTKFDRPIDLESESTNVIEI